MALPVGRRADPASCIIGRVRVDDVEGGSLESEGREALIQLHARLLDVPFDLIALRILRQHAAERDRTSAMRLQKRWQGPDRQSCIALRAENAHLVFERRRIDGDNYMRRVDPEIRQHVLIKNGPQKSVPVVEPCEKVPRRGAPRSPIETGRHRAGSGAQERILQDDARCPAREADVVDTDVNQRASAEFEDVLWSDPVMVASCG